MQYEDNEEIWPDEDRTSGASIADGELGGFNAEWFSSGPNKGTYLLARLEQAMTRAERMNGAIEATFTHFAAVEKHLIDVCGRCQASTQLLHAGIDSANRIQNTLQGLLARADNNADRLAAHHAAAGNVQEQPGPVIADGHPGLESTEEPIRVREESFTQSHPTEVGRRLSRSVDPFARISTEAPRGQPQFHSNPSIDETTAEPKDAIPPTSVEDFTRLIEEAMG